MRIKFLLLISVFTTAHQLPCFSQCVVVKVKMNDCISCYNGLNFIDNEKIKLPLFAVFRSIQRRDSLAIDYKLGLGPKCIQPLFNDELFKKMNGGNEQVSTVTVFNDHRQEIYSNNLKHIKNTNFIDSLGISARLNETQTEWTKWTPTRRISFDQSVNTIKVYKKGENDPLYSLNAREFKYELLRNALRSDRLQMFDEVGKKLSTSSNLAASFSWADVDSNNNIYALLNYHNARKDSDTSVTATDDFAIVTYNASGKIGRVLPFYESKSDTENQYTGRFFIAPGIGYFLPTHYWKRWFEPTLEENGNKDLKFLSAFTEQGKELLWNRKVNILLPLIYKQKYFENYLSSEYCQYPIAAFPLANGLYNIETGDSTYLMDNKLYLRKMKEKGSKFEGSTHNESFEIRGLNVDAARKEVYTVTRLDSAYFLSIHSLDLKLKKTVPLPIGGLSRVDAADVDVYDRVLYLRDTEASKYLALPLLLFQ